VIVKQTSSYLQSKKRILIFSFKSLKLKQVIFLLIVVCAFVFSGVSTNNTRQMSSLTELKSDFLSTSVNPTQSISLEPLLIRLKTASGFQISKMEITLHLDTLQSVQEIQQSMKQIRNHLVFILSDQDEVIFTTPYKEEKLKEDIIRQLNVFLFTGQIKKIDIQQITLN